MQCLATTWEFGPAGDVIRDEAASLARGGIVGLPRWRRASMTVDVTADGRFVVEGRLCAAPKVDCRALGGSKDVWGLGARCPPAQSSPAN